MRFFRITTLFVGLFVYVLVAHAQMTSTNYQIQWDSINAGGEDTSSSSSYMLRDEVSATSPGNSTSTNYQLDGGYRQGIYDQIIDFDLFVQSGSTGVVATSLSSTSVYTTTASFSVNDYVAVVQDIGASQVAGIGKVASVQADHLVLDEIVDGGVSPVIDGTNDYVFKLTGTSADFSTFSTSSVSTVIIGFDVTADNDNGYVVQIKEGGNLQDMAANDINDVLDGAVSVGNEEYGARSSDSTISGSTFDTEDTAITSSFQDIVTESSSQYMDKNFLTLKASISTGTVSGTYSQSLQFIVSGNY